MGKKWPIGSALGNNLGPTVGRCSGSGTGTGRRVTVVISPHGRLRGRKCTRSVVATSMITHAFVGIICRCRSTGKGQ